MPKSRTGTFVRFVIAGVLVIGFAATATAVAGLLQVKQITDYFNASPSFASAPSRVTVPNPGSPQTILLVGSDHRAGTPFRDVNTDTMMLVRLNPSSSTINLLSVPRDLKVQIPEGGGVATAKLNAAYFYGGPNLLIKILQQQVFPGLKINHVVDVGFGGFERMINALGCVYTDVDHRYYNNTAVTDYSSIDIQPGYQNLCGADALSFVRFRHTDSDIVRNARQQDFIRWAKSQFSQDQIITERNKLLKIFGKNATTDHNLHTTDGLINLFDLVAFSAGNTIKQIPFPAIILPCYSGPTNGANAQTAACYVTAENSAEQSAFRAFMTPTTGSPLPVASAPAQPAKAGKGSHGGGGGGPVPGLTADVTDGQAQAKALGPTGIPVYYPKVIFSGSQYCSSQTSLCPVQTASPGSYPRAYLLHDQHGVAHYAYRMTLEINPILGEYYGVQGTTWLNPPILSKPTQTKTVNGKQLLLFADGGKLSLVAWRTANAVYWISNTLTENIPNRQLVAIAASLTRAGGR
ncbi:MAG TPA: LCP family protein [Solirubrobacteraceae bacterium]|nr:LCP family protein [Solirubrobacteraceae bacterium]